MLLRDLAPSNASQNHEAAEFSPIQFPKALPTRGLGTADRL
jgi:hypothetical protein